MESALDEIKPSDLPAPPQAAIQIMRACAHSEVNNQELAKISSTDPVLTAELLRIVNSAFFGMSGEVSNVTRAINILGHKALRNMVLCISVRDALKPDDIEGFDSTGFWEDTLRRATAGKLIGRSIGLDGDECFTACLLQDFGLLVMFYAHRGGDAKWNDFSSLDPDKRLQREQEVFAVTHDQVSLMLAEKWMLPESFRNAIGFHHQPEKCPDESSMRLAQVMHCADWLAALFSAPGKARILQQVHAKLKEYFGYLEEQGMELLNQIPDQVEDAADALGLHLQSQEDFEEVIREANVMLAEENTSYQELTWQLEQALKERDDLAAALAQELELAAEIQRSLLPAKQNSGFPVYGVNISARELSGDFFDYFTLDDGSIHFNLGDVSGKGITASLLMAKTSSLFRCLGKREYDPGKLMAQINDEICETSIRGMFVTMIAGRFNPDTGHVQLVNAGNPPVLIVQDGKIKKVDAGAPPLGIVPGIEFPVIEFDLKNGHLISFSDGVTEGYIGKGQEMGMQGLIELLEKSAKHSPKQQLDNVLNCFTDARVQQRDDITILVLEHYPTKYEKILSYEFNSMPAELMQMRQQVRKALKSRQCNKTCIDRLLLAVNEAAMNIMQHAYSDAEDGQIKLEILCKQSELVFRLTDFACPIDRSCVKGRDLNDIKPGGLGVHFMHEIMDEVRFLDDCKNAGNILLMRKKLDASCLKGGS